MSAISIKYFYFQVMNIFIELLNKILLGKSFSYKTSTEAFFENRGHNFLDIEKTLQKRNLRQTLFDLGQLEKSRGHCETGCNL